MTTVNTSRMNPRPDTTVRGRVPWTSAGVLVVAAILIRLLFFVGYQGRDDRNYIAYADYLNNGHTLSSLPAQTQWVGRIGFWLPLASSIKWLGTTQAAYTAVPLICSLAGIAVILLLGNMTVGRRAAVLAAILLVFMPLDVLYATKAYPDGPVALFMVLSFCLILRSRSSDSVPMALAAGLAMGAAYLIKETAVFAFVPLALVMRPWSTKYWRHLAALGAAFLFVFAIELSVWTIVKGDPLYRFHVTNSALETAGQAMGQADTRFLGVIPGPRPGDAYRSKNTVLDAALMLTTNEEFALFYWVGIPVLMLLAWWRDSATRELRLWIATLLLLFLFLPMVQAKYTLPRDPRYFTPLTIPLLLMLAAYLLTLRPLLRVIGIGLLVSTALLGSFVGAESAKMEPQTTLARRYLARGETIWVTPQLATDLLMLTPADQAAHVRVHFIEQTQRAGSFEAIELVRPDTRIAEATDAIQGGWLVLRERSAKEPPPGWTRTARLTGTPSTVTAFLQGALRSSGLGSFAKKIAPGGGEAVLIYRCDAPACREAS